jgi:hypothetical protein
MGAWGRAREGRHVARERQERRGRRRCQANRFPNTRFFWRSWRLGGLLLFGFPGVPMAGSDHLNVNDDDRDWD